MPADLPALAITGPEQGVLTLRLQRPQRLNALTLELARELLAAVHAAELDPAVRALLLTAEGRAFCAGKDRDDPATVEFVDVLQQLAAALMGSARPVVAAVHGWAVGAGVELLLNCDLVVAARDAKFQLPEVNVGLLGTGGVMALLARQVGLARAKGLLLLGDAFSAEEAQRWGMLWGLADDAAAAEAMARALAVRLAGGHARLAGIVKQAVHAECVGDIEAMLAREAALHRGVVAG